MQRVALLTLAGALLAAGSAAEAQMAQAPRRGPDLGIGRGLDSHRPNILVAWRNTERILEVEILVRNLGDQAARGVVHLEIADEEGKTLLATKPFDVVVPARAEGGEEGTIVQTKGFRMMNIMFDELDRLDQRYKLRAVVQTQGDDLNLLDNVATKAFNVDSRALPSSTNTYRYRLTNASDNAVKARVFLDHNPLPDGWTMSAEPAAGTEITLAPREVFMGHVTVKTPYQLSDGQYLDLMAGLSTTKNGKQVVLDQDEWFLVATNQPPQVDPPTVAAQPDGSVTVNVAAYDSICGIKEASGVQVAYSLDRGTTFSTRVMAYTRGNFYDKTWFEANLGPFAPGTEVTPIVTVSNNAGIVKRFELPPVKVHENTTAKGATKKRAPGSQ